jgi:TIR domain
VFLSYASEDWLAAERIATALRASGIEVWFDKTDLRGGDVWDRQIRKQIHECALFIPIISGHSQARLEGYFRREWKLAADPHARHGRGKGIPRARRHRRHLRTSRQLRNSYRMPKRLATTQDAPR